MKTLLIILLSLGLIFGIAQAFISKSTSNTEGHKYTVIKDFGDFEIREYEPAVFSYVVMDSATYKDVSSQGFRQLAGYIFGGNEKQQSIAMTTPVEMTMSDSMVMKFRVPDNMEMDSLPKPNNPNIQFEQQGKKTVAAIRFDGWTSDAKIKKYTDKLKASLDSNSISYHGEFSFLGYNPPYQVNNRRNEIIVAVDWDSSTEK